MCGVLVSSKNIDNLNTELLNFRGPDASNQIKKNNVTYLQTLLSITGEFTEQPIIRDNVVFLYNGEIYNYNDSFSFPSDIYVIIEKYFNYGEDFIKHLDGEFAIIIADYRKNILFFATDIFGTKPLFFSDSEKDFGLSSNRESLEELGFLDIIKAEPSSIYKIDLNTYKIIEKNQYFSFDLNNNKKHFNDWEDAFIDSVKKRFHKTDKKIILPLSSGFDSGAILCAFNILNINFASFSFFNYEHEKVLNKRLKKIVTPNEFFTKDKLSGEERVETLELMKSRCAKFYYDPGLQEQKDSIDGFQDSGSLGLAYLLNFMQNIDSDLRILASGHGADEIMSNIQSYTLNESNPKIFPKKLDDIFPWENFYLGTQSSYLSKEESITGGFGVEGRYPFLDKNVVQEFLYLDSDLKNSTFKSPIVYFLKKNNFPYRKKSFRFPRNEDLKSGFNA